MIASKVITMYYNVKLAFGKWFDLQGGGVSLGFPFWPIACFQFDN